MLAHDAFRARLDAATARARALASRFGDVATIEHEETPTFWRLGMRPDTAGACAFEAIVDIASQRLDLTVGPVTIEGIADCDPGLLSDMIEAIAGGDVAVREFTTAATGAFHSAELIVGHDPPLWSTVQRRSPIAGRLPAADCIASDRPFAPYRR